MIRQRDQTGPYCGHRTSWGRDVHAERVFKRLQKCTVPPVERYKTREITENIIFFSAKDCVLFVLYSSTFIRWDTSLHLLYGWIGKLQCNSHSVMALTYLPDACKKHSMTSVLIMAFKKPFEFKNTNFNFMSCRERERKRKRETVKERRKALTALDSIHLTLPFTKRKALHEW